MLKKLAISTLLIAALSTPAIAKTPPEVLASYKAYNTAKKAGDRKAALKHAKKAWELAEAKIGDGKTTGDLAYNYALVLPPSSGEKAIKALDRAIELSPEATQAEAISKLERYVAISQLIVTTDKFKRAGKYLRNADALIQEKGLEKSTFDGEVKALSGLLSYASRRDGAAARKYDEALEIFQGDGHTYQSIFPYAVRIYKGNLLRWDDPIEAALEYQVVMQNLEGVVTKDHPIVKTAFNKWLFMMSLINEKDKLADAEAAGVCKCWPYDEMRSGSVIPAMRIPPVMPRSARRSGHVNFKFDVDDNGKVINPEVISATQDRFIKPALKSLQAWEYEPFVEGDDPTLRKGIMTKISFRLTDQRGNLIPEPGETR